MRALLGETLRGALRRGRGQAAERRAARLRRNQHRRAKEQARRAERKATRETRLALEAQAEAKQAEADWGKESRGWSTSGWTTVQGGGGLRPWYSDWDWPWAPTRRPRVAPDTEVRAAQDSSEPLRPGRPTLRTALTWLRRARSSGSTAPSTRASRLCRPSCRTTHRSATGGHHAPPQLY
jgi:hypothetical protein